MRTETADRCAREQVPDRDHLRSPGYGVATTRSEHDRIDVALVREDTQQVPAAEIPQAGSVIIRATERESAVWRDGKSGDRVGMARQHVTVALSGDGGDENFIGYRRYRLFSMEERLRSLFPDRFRTSVFGFLGDRYPKLDWAPRVFRGKTTFQALARDSMQAYLHGVSIFPEEGRDWLFSDTLKRELQGYRSDEVFKGHIAGKSFEDPLRMVQYLDFKTYLPGDILTKVDRASMAHSLEVRVPFLDHTFVSWVASLPTQDKLHGSTGKHVLKEALRPLLPHEVLFRKKMGFAVPLGLWFRGSLKERTVATVCGDRLKQCGLFAPEGLERLVNEHQSGKRDWTAALWALMMFDGFLKSDEASPGTALES